MRWRPGRNTGSLIIKFILEMEIIIDPEENFDERYRAWEYKNKIKWTDRAAGDKEKKCFL